ncbi:hypothetical protein [Epilithonimonas hominis]|uniref:hypothetical protein n=1 Tax=Epilithonimonas hominis TaxID=420404 RepID=UPI000ED1CA81|nr:hypothetical protein [Epilithonimonas hominis]HAP95669.1 hypothetical protein [Chryseobacterium sp.]
MENVSISKLVEFRRKTERSKRTFAEKLYQLEGAKKSDDGGGDYWVRSLSAINKAYLNNNNQFIHDKIEDITDDLQNTTVNKTKTMYERNLQILHNFEEIDFIDLIPVAEFEFLEKQAKKANFDVNEFPIKIKFNQLYSFNENDTKFLGGILFVAKLGGYTKDELGIFAEAFFRYLKQKYSNGYEISKNNVKVIDVFTMNEVTFDMLENGEVPKFLESTIDAIKNLKLP